MDNILEVLPAEIIVRMLSFLSINQLMNMRVVNSTLLQLIDSDFIGWKTITFSTYPFLKHYRESFKHVMNDDEMLESKNWQQLCKQLKNVWKFDESTHHDNICLCNNRFTAKNCAAEPNQSTFAERACIAIATQPILEGLFYFEVIIDFISTSSKIGIGICAANASLDEPLWHSKGGALYTDGTSGHQHDSAGDVVGVFIDFSSGGPRTVTFTLNGLLLNTPYWHVPQIPMYPAVVLFGQGDQVTLNPFAGVFEMEETIAFKHTIYGITME